MRTKRGKIKGIAASGGKLNGRSYPSCLSHYCPHEALHAPMVSWESNPAATVSRSPATVSAHYSRRSRVCRDHFAGINTQHTDEPTRIIRALSHLHIKPSFVQRHPSLHGLILVTAEIHVPWYRTPCERR